MSKNYLPFQINTIIFIFAIFVTKWLTAAILDVPNSLLIAFLAISDRDATFLFLIVLPNGCGRPFWMSEIHFRWHFWPFQINTKLCLMVFTRWPTAPILDIRNSLSIAFLAILDRYATLFFLEISD